MFHTSTHKREWLFAPDDIARIRLETFEATRARLSVCERVVARMSLKARLSLFPYSLDLEASGLHHSLKYA
jgi:hypothetical protein